MSSLAQGPDAVDHVYAGTNGGYPNSDPASPGGVLWETDTSSASPLTNWLPDTPPPCGSIWHILVINEFRRIVLACDSGVWWSPIPPAPAAHGTYQWQAPIPGLGLKPVPFRGNSPAWLKDRAGGAWPAADGRHYRRIGVGRHRARRPDFLRRLV